MNGSIYPSNTNTFWLLGLKDEVTGEFINDATVTWEIRTQPWTAAGVAQGSQVADGSGEYVDDSDGNYFCDVPSDTPLAKGTKYYRRVIAEAETGDFLAEDEFIATRRTGKTPTS